jgi:hypothetical protein
VEPAHVSAQVLHCFYGAGVDAHSLGGRLHCRPPSENSFAEGRQHNAAKDAKRIDQARAGYRAPAAISNVRLSDHLPDLEYFCSQLRGTFKVPRVSHHAG